MERSRSRRSGLRADSAHYADFTHDKSPPPMNRRQTTGHSPSAGTARPRFVNQASFMSSDTMMSEESWPEEDAPEHRNSRNEQPMSPFVVILYVVFFYLVWQVMTRSDDDEIFSHLPSTSPLRGQQPTHAMAEPKSQQQAYQFPYPLPQFHSPVREVEKVASSTWRTVVQSVLYPFYFLLTLAVIPLPFLNQALTLIMSIVGTILYPITSTTRLLSRTFIVGPLQIMNGLFQALYPAYVFIGGVLGLGCFLGVSAGYIGQYSLDFLLSRKSANDRKSTRRKTKKHRSHSSRVPDSPEFATAEGTSRNASALFERSSSIRRQPLPSDLDFRSRYVPVVDIWDNLDRAAANSSPPARQPVVVGLRRRGMRSTT